MARVDWRVQAGGRGKTASLGLGGGAFPAEGPRQPLRGFLCLCSLFPSPGCFRGHRELPAAGQGSGPPPCFLPGVRVSRCPRGASLLPLPAQAQPSVSRCLAWVSSQCPG